jgi:hypothetical protein
VRGPFVAFVAVVLLTACGESSLYKQSDFPFAASYPFVAKIQDPVLEIDCTGVFLSPVAFLTAGHCVKRAGTFVLVSSQGVRTAREAARLGPGTSEDTGDLVLMTVDEENFPGPFPRIGRRAEVGEELSLVGFGCSAWEDRQTNGEMRIGVNRVAYAADFLYLLSPLAPVRELIGSESTGLCYGDSGAPALRLGSPPELVGLGHAVYRDDAQHYSLLVDLTQPAQLAFLKAQDEALRLGIDFSE